MHYGSMPLCAPLCRILAFLGFSLVPFCAYSAPLPGWYVELHGGYNAYDSGNTLTSPTARRSVDADDGLILGAALGYRAATGHAWLDAARVEVEYSFRSNPLVAVGTTPQGGDLLSHTAMVNVLYDFTNPTVFTPYLGAGYGFSEFDLDGDDETAEAWQVLLGVDYVPDFSDRVLWGLRYRYLDTDTGPVTYSGQLSDLTYENHSVEVTSRLRF